LFAHAFPPILKFWSEKGILPDRQPSNFRSKSPCKKTAYYFWSLKQFLSPQRGSGRKEKNGSLCVLGVSAVNKKYFSNT
jgi:hypothetical protein